MANKTKVVLTVNEVAKYLRMNPMTIYCLAQQGRIPASKILGCWRFKRQEIEAWMKPQEIQSLKILVIDDNSLIGSQIREALEKKHHVIAVENAHDAIKILECEEFNLIFLDLNLPCMNGLTLYKQVISWKNTPVVIITGLLDGAILSQVINEGAQFILHKPFTNNEVRLMLSFSKA